MTEDIADAILDWIDTDDEMREFGAESDYYSTLVPGYAPKNGPLDSIDELLLVRDVTPSLLYGVDANRNNHADSMEPDSQGLIDVDNSDGTMNSGWAAYLTVHSYESNTTEEGETKIDLNQDDLEALYDELSEALSTEWATFIVGYRQNGASTNANAQPASSVQRDQINFEGQQLKEISSILDLVGVGTQINTQGSNNNTPTALAPMLEENSSNLETDLPKLLDAVTVSSEETLSGRININQASRVVLLTIPGMTEDAADQIIYNRIEDPTEADEDQSYSVWPLIRGLVDLTTIKSLEPYVCTGGSGLSCPNRGVLRRRAAPGLRSGSDIRCYSEPPPTVLSWNDIGHLGQGYPIEMLGIE